MKPRAVLILVLTLGLLAAPLATEAQPAGRVPQIGYPSFAGKDRPQAGVMAAFVSGLHDLGYVEGQNMVIEYLTAYGPNLPEMFRQLARYVDRS
jgi:hypothetical protein